MTRIQLGPVLGAAMALAIGPSHAVAQQVEACTVQLDSVGGEGRHVEVAPGVVHQFASGGVWASCRGQDTRMRANSVAWYSERDRVDFIGGVRFHDAAVDLDARLASYFLKDERLEAFGNVRLVNRDTGSELTGPTLTYWRPAPAVRDTEELFATERPTVRYHASGDSAGAEPYVIIGQRVRMKGGNRAWAAGDVTVDRSDFSARADSAALDLDAGNGAFVGHADVHGRDGTGYTLSGRRIAFRLADRRLNWVEAQGMADAVSADWRLSADTVAFDVMGDRIQRGTAWGDSTRPRALSDRYTMTADSLGMDTPGQQLKELRGFGSAIALAARDSTDGQPDWIAGDSLVAQFDTIPGGRRILVHLEATGAAKAYYRVYEADNTTLAGINYSRGTKLIADFGEVGIQKVRVLGKGDGVYLEPVKRTP